MQCIHLSVLDTSWSYLHLHLPLTLRCSLTGRLSVVWRPVHMVHHSFTEINPCENRIKSRQNLFFAPSQAPNLPPGSLLFPQVWVRFSANAKKLHNVVFNNEETFPASQLSFFSSAWSFSSEKNGKSVAALLDVTSPVELVDRWTGHSGQRGIQLTVGNPSELSGPQPSKNLLGHIWKRNNWQLFDSLKRVKISPVKPMKNIANNKYYQNTFTTRYDVGPLSLVRPHPRPPRPFVHGLGAIGADRNLPLSQHLREPRLGTWKKWKKWENGKEHL